MRRMTQCASPIVENTPTKPLDRWSTTCVPTLIEIEHNINFHTDLCYVDCTW